MPQTPAARGTFSAMMDRTPQTVSQKRARTKPSFFQLLCQVFVIGMRKVTNGRKKGREEDREGLTEGGEYIIKVPVEVIYSACTNPPTLAGPTKHKPGIRDCQHSHLYIPQ